MPGGPRREMPAVLGLCLLGAVSALAAAAPAWLRIQVPRSHPLADAVVAVPGRSVAPLVPALGLAGLAALVGLVATRGRGRAVLGVLLLLAGAAVVLAAVPHLAAPDPPAAQSLLPRVLPGRDLTRPLRPQVSPLWPVLAAAGGLLLAAAGLAAALRGRRWPAMSGRYDAPAARRRQVAPQPGSAGLWDALDRGDDPTAAGPGTTGR
jgi:uncharacterized membrane protein (TIGR02234 family)